MGLLSAPPPEPNLELLAPVGSYFTDGDQLLYILESDHSGAIGEDCMIPRGEKTGSLCNIEPAQLVTREGEERPDWRRVYPTEGAV